MQMNRAFYAIIVAGGQGQRTGLSIPKQYAMLGESAVLDWSVAAFARHADCIGIVLVVADGDAARAANAAASASTHIVVGGATRQASVAAGMAGVLALLPTGPADGSDPIVMVHDAARPGITSDIVDALLDALSVEGRDGALPALAVADTLAQREDAPILGSTVSRDMLVRVQTPQAFRLSTLRSAHRTWSGSAATDDAQMVRAAGGIVAIVPGDTRLDKITNAGDLERMTAILSEKHDAPTHAPAMLPAVGSGFDVHRLIPGDGLWLGGVFIAHTHTLEGHSDADVVLHALTDALLGAIAAGDIGSHFPPSDPQWKGAASSQFLAHARDLVTETGARITHVDCTVMCEAPKVGPHREAIRQRIAELLDLPVNRVAVKATTTERLGFTGRGEGIAAQATATIIRPEDVS